MFSGLSKLLDKAFVLGFFLPSLLGICGLAFANRDLPFFKSLLERATADTEKIGNIASFLALTWVLAVILMALNSWIYQLLEGYKWPFRYKVWKRSQLAKRKKQLDYIDRLKVELDTAVGTINRLKDKTNATIELNAAEQDRLAVREKLFPAQEKNARQFPPSESLVLPTSFGNALRAFEMYSTEVYNADSIFIWPRLLAVVPKDYQTIIADARASVDFLVGLIALGTLTTAFGVIRALHLWLTKGMLCEDLIVHLLVTSLAAGALSICSYRLAITAAQRWGDVVKGAFDLYLPALAQQLGFTLPELQAEQRVFWGKWSKQFRFHSPASTDGWARVVPNPSGSKPPLIKSNISDDEDKELAGG